MISLIFQKLNPVIFQRISLKFRFHEITSFVETTFKHVSESKNLRFAIDMDENLPDSLETDIQRLNQILKNLLSNAFKFTEKGEVKLRIYEAKQKLETKNNQP